MWLLFETRDSKVTPDMGEDEYNGGNPGDAPSSAGSGPSSESKLNLLKELDMVKDGRRLKA